VHKGSCHCGAIELRLTLSSAPEETPVRACACSFCRAHGARTVTNPDGQVEVRVQDPVCLRRYRFGLETADYLICASCGVYVGALADTESGLRATVNVNALDDRDSFDDRPPAVSYDGESAETRLARRAAHWTPASIRIGSSQ
jgi:hypothetical protein